MALLKSFKDLRNIFQEVLELKNSATEQNSEYSNPDVYNEKRKFGSLGMVVLKKINRMEKYKLREKRDELHKEKIQVDINRLQLQNLLYEVNHLDREIRYCRQFKSQDEEVELLSFDEYAKLCEETFKYSENEHKQRLMHLECELKLRRKLSKQSKQLLQSKKEVIQDIVLSVEKLASFGPHLKSLMEASLPLQDTLQMPVNNEWKIKKLIQLLPQPLYVVYVNLYALQQFEMFVNVKVLGSEEDVNSLEFSSQMSQLKHYKRSCSKQQLNEEEKFKFLIPHPLVIRFMIGAEENMENAISIDLRYFPELGFVTASSEAQFKESDTTSDEITSSRNILSYLYDNDHGDDIPSEDIQYKLLNLNITVEECMTHLNSNNNGKPYKWLQQLCCIKDPEIPTQNPNVQLKNTKYHKVIPEIVKQIQNVWKCHVNLIQQIRQVISKSGEDKPQQGCLVQWTSLTWEQYNSSVSSISLQYQQNNMVDDTDIFYRAIFVRGAAKLDCLISISNKFPQQSPLWIISIHCSNGLHNSHNNTALKIMEYLTNSITQQQSEQSGLSLIAAQVQRTLQNFNIFLETDGRTHQHHSKGVSKRIRALSYVFDKF